MNCGKRWWVLAVVAFGIVKLVTFLFVSRYLYDQLADKGDSTSDIDSYHESRQSYPRTIPQTRIRRASKGGKPVSLGRLDLVGGLSPFALGRSFVNLSGQSDPTVDATGGRGVRGSGGSLLRDYQWRKLSPQISYAQFNSLLQCSEHEPDLDGLRGTLALARLAPVTRDTVRILAAYVESEGSCSPWAQCRRLAAHLESSFAAMGGPGGKPPSSLSDAAAEDSSEQMFAKVFKKVMHAPVDDRTRLIRIVGGVLYTDWPWGAWRWNKIEGDYFVLRLLGAVAEITALPDCVLFLRNYDYPLFPAFVPMPAMSHAPTNHHADIPLPWVRAVDEEIAWYRDQLMDGRKELYRPLFYDDSASLLQSSSTSSGFSIRMGQGNNVNLGSGLAGSPELKDEENSKSNRRRLSQRAKELLTTTGSGITGTTIEVISRVPVPPSSTSSSPRFSPSAQSKPSTYPLPDETTARKAWIGRRSTAAFYGYLWGTPSATARQVALDLARQHPDLFEVGWTAAFDVQAWNPLSDERNVLNTEALLKLKAQGLGKRASSGSDTNVASLPAGFLRSYQGQVQKQRVSPYDYLSSTKYLLVLSGNNGADRLGPFLAHSGAVLLLQENDALSHFSHRLRPWVHYVPVTHSAADLADKVRWLQQNDDLAYQLARNAYFFGRSFLRLEDYYCYTARSIFEIADVETQDSKTPFSGIRPAFPVRY